MSHRRPVRPVRLAVVGAVGLALAAGLATTASATQGHHAKPAGKPKPKPTVVLVHGAWADSAGWSGVAKRLQADGYRVTAPATPLRGLGSDAAYLADYLKTINGPVVLVGHSYGGAVITNAATGNPNVKALVYVAAFAPDKGESVTDLVGKFPGSHLSDDPDAPLPTALNAVPSPRPTAAPASTSTSSPTSSATSSSATASARARPPRSPRRSAPSPRRPSASPRP